ncbi:MAG TPA: DoxX family protein [Vicinamibacterales bacterium]|jgi:putative oxidoreductase
MSYERIAAYVYPLFRFVFGMLFLCHGLQKFGLFGGRLVPLASRLGAAAFIEVVCGPLIAVGAFTHLAAFIASGEMAFAYFLQHYPRAFWPIQNMGEVTVLYCFAFLYIAARGAGRWGFDKS